MTMTEVTQSYAYLDVNPVIITSDNKIILTKRIDEVLEGGKWHFPGGRVLAGERIESALRRHTKRKTGLDITLHRGSLVEDLIGVYDDPARDPRGHVIALAYLCRVVGGEARPGYNVSEVAEFDEESLKGVEIGFDHKQIALDSLKHIKNSI
ncbi:MAG: NUDIX hydrolase [archaeon]|nr:NUDIX hydrolase [archaeon]MCP8305596.1 NUDIX hydrolase [archaeon]